MNIWKLLLVLTAVCGLALLAQQGAKQSKPGYRTSPVGYDDTPVLPGQKWKVHDIARPQPKLITPASVPGGPPSDAVVLFDGKDLSNWTSMVEGQPTKWIVTGDAMSPTPKSGMIKTKQEFGSCQLHVEWATPKEVKGEGQGRGNSGVYLMGQYEVQVLDSYGNTTYPDGQAGALYGRQKPLVNASRKPGEWQSYDIVFHRPIFENGQVVKRATFTVFHNGVLVQDHTELSGGTGWRGPHSITPYAPHGDKGPIMLQDHGNPVLFRNVWIRELKE